MFYEHIAIVSEGKLNFQFPISLSRNSSSYLGHTARPALFQFQISNFEFKFKFPVSNFTFKELFLIPQSHCQADSKPLPGSFMGIGVFFAVYSWSVLPVLAVWLGKEKHSACSERNKRKHGRTNLGLLFQKFHVVFSKISKVSCFLWSLFVWTRACSYKTL